MAYADLDTQSTGRGRRPTFVVLVLFGIIIVAAVSRWLDDGQGAGDGGGAVRLAVLSGSGTVVRADGSILEVQPGHVPPVLGSGDELNTGSGAQARLSLGRAGVVEAGEFVRLLILDIRPASLGRGEAVGLALLRGTLQVAVQEAAFAAPEVSIETSVVTVQARGARFTLQALAADHVGVEAQRGVLTVAMGQQTVRLVRGQYLDAWLGQPLEPQGTPLPDEPAGGAPPTDGSGWDYWDESNRTLFPPIVTPTRPGDPAAGGNPATAGAPPGAVYVVQPGDTLYSIARQYGLSWEELWEANKAQLAAPDLLQVGQELRIPR